MADEVERCPDCGAAKGESIKMPCSAKFFLNKPLHPFHEIPDVPAGEEPEYA